MASHSSILAWRIPWTEEPEGLQSTGSQRVRHDESDLARVFLEYAVPTWVQGLLWLSWNAWRGLMNNLYISVSCPDPWEWWSWPRGFYELPPSYSSSTRVCIRGQETLTFCGTLPGSPGDKTLHILTLRHDRLASPSHSLASLWESSPVAAGHVVL